MIDGNSKVRQKMNDKKNYDYTTKQKPLVTKNITQNKLLQFVKFINAIYKGKQSNWGKKQKQQVNDAISMGKSKLDKAMSETQDMLIRNCIGQVKNAISDGDLKIYKLKKPSFLAMSVPNGPLEISLNIIAHKGNVNEISKTLIHECFHIKCAGLTGNDEYACNNSKDDARNEIENKSNSNKINPDSFAQFVMQC